jgi:putative membrane protein
MGIGILLLLIILIVAAVLIARNYPFSGRVGPTSDALRVLQERYARGEIDEQEYQRRREQLLR